MADPTPSLRTVRNVVLLVDLSGHARASREHDDLAMAEYLHAYYCACERIVSAHAGVVVKFIGDACLATFAETDAPGAVHAALQIAREIADIGERHGIRLRPGANIHLARFVAGEVGMGTSRRHDVLGRGVNQTFLLGRGPGIRISEPVYRKLASADRSPWKKHKPPAVYRLDESDAGILEFGGKSAAENTQRW